mmetsp:Transcript_59500/g.133766  ORF Transcript_59500/g.133766 Transcript_59500/m.133766 type:complete len:254 (+) Transcript_59500:81-842(+)
MMLAVLTPGLRYPATSGAACTPAPVCRRGVLRLRAHGLELRELFLVALLVLGRQLLVLLPAARVNLLPLCSQDLGDLGHAAAFGELCALVHGEEQVGAQTALRAVLLLLRHPCALGRLLRLGQQAVCDLPLIARAVLCCRLLEWLALRHAHLLPLRADGLGDLADGLAGSSETRAPLLSEHHVGVLRALGILWLRRLREDGGQLQQDATVAEKGTDQGEKGCGPSAAGGFVLVECHRSRSLSCPNRRGDGKEL